ncbi:hypothetical protein ABR461_003270 [Enterobacter hormaechei]|nr:hypothetical protein [Enterobacter hormaechei]HCM9430686.1 hypothetical protein [Enterobacter hormaechei subsp. steigerwaltii]
MLFGKKNTNSVPSFTQDFHYLTALIQHLGAHEKWNSRTPRNIADSLGMDINEVDRVLRSYPAFFRRSGNLSAQGEPLFMIHLRYARRRKNAEDGSRESPPVEPAELSMMLDLVTKMISVEEQGRRLSVDERNNSLKLWLAIILAAMSTLTTLVVAYVK